MEAFNQESARKALRMWTEHGFMSSVREISEHLEAALNHISFLNALSTPAGCRWLPMETAPKNGDEVLLKVERRAGVPGKCLVGHYMPGGHCIEDHPPISKGWYFWNGCSFDEAAKPLGWLPLPKEAPQDDTRP